MTTEHVTPKIYVACLASYNNGFHHGAWIDANQDADAIQEAVNAMLATSTQEHAEEWAIHDYEGFYSLRLSEWEGFERVAALAAFIEEHGELGALLVDHFCNDLDAAEAVMSDGYAGCWRSLADYAQELTEETTEIPATLINYIDYEAMARDMELGGDVFTIETGFDQVHIFWNR
jgi:antirestriction protein